MSNSLMPIIQIWDSVGLGLIINHPTGILISNQTGGTACIQSFTEGVYLPLCNDYSIDTHKFISPEIELTEYFTNEKYNDTGAINGIDIDDAQHITKIISKFGLQNFIKIDIEKLQQSHEAWIYVTIYPDNNNISLLNNFDYPLKGILTWCNSD